MLAKRIRVWPLATVALVLALWSGLIATGVDGAGPVTPAASSTTATPAAIKALLVTCPMPTGVVIPGAADYFAPWGLGGPPLWMDFWGNPPAALRQQYPDRYVPYVGPHFVGPTGHGWFFRVVWVMAGGWTKPVTLSGTRVGGGASLWFEPGDQTPATTAVLDPAHPGIPVQHDDFREWPSYLYFPETGCYELHARWQGGGWTARIPFVAPVRAAMPTGSPASPTAAD